MPELLEDKEKDDPVDDSMEDSNIQSSVNFSVFNHPMKDWEIVAIPIFAIIVAELLLYMGKLEAGILLHVMIPLGIAISTMWMRESNVTFSLEALAMLPILRLVNISMPVFVPTMLYLYVFIYFPLIIPVYFIVRHQKISLKELGFTLDHLYLYIPIAVVVGYMIGYGEHSIIHAGSLIPDTSALSIFKLSFVMLFFVGLVEELIFRSLLQTRLETAFGMTKGLLITSLLFGIMHSGYGQAYELLMTGLAGLLMGYMFQKTRSLPFIAISHGLVNVFLFGLIPLLGTGLGLF
ncbi:type II CAAX endopeptidase family protein [uncultured Methanomethylovorans sp.]|uniref:CPBP family intramembrane glutamic endopeptidase n=1 Tax=uncultured Methanomethylovorans sp. TaxID=183759 RepID=UPI002AA626C4|nr:type II CAAX endopeptidase family protein [uncultured Methanomethylovorans sp.]